ncbi:MAG TPA: hypothetical protein PK076_07775 [Saprospiraceae bacterium]|nr:hypothetical protein [Saprospiraceae bacterium]
MSAACTAQTVSFRMDSESATRINAYNAAEQRVNTVKVYRIQYAVMSDRMAMEMEIRKFKSDFDIVTDWHQKGPYYYMKAGAYQSKLAAFSDILAIRKVYPGAIFVVEEAKKRLLL